MSDKSAGKRLFLRYAWPCAEYKRFAKKITDEEFKELSILVKTGKEPSVALLERCFKDAVVSLRKFAEKTDAKGGAWSFETVAEFWRFHHGHKDDCRVRRARILHFVDSVVVMLICMEKNFFALNVYGIPLKLGGEVYVHKSVIVEKI